MSGFPSPFGDRSADGDLFDEYDEFVPEHLPDPGTFLIAHNVLVGPDHVAFHKITRDVFENRGVYDMTFGYNLARLNLDSRHADAGYRYAVEADDSSVLRAEFTPTTAFCPQSETLTKGSFRAWNGCRAEHEYDLVCVRVNGIHNRSVAINRTLKALETKFRETGSVTQVAGGEDESSVPGNTSTNSERWDTSDSGNVPDAPF